MIPEPSSNAPSLLWKKIFVLFVAVLGGFLFNELTPDPETDVEHLCRTQSYVKVYKEVPVPPRTYPRNSILDCSQRYPGADCYFLEDQEGNSLKLMQITRSTPLSTKGEPGLLRLIKGHIEYRSELSGEIIAEGQYFVSTREAKLPFMHPLNAEGCWGEVSKKLTKALFKESNL